MGHSFLNPSSFPAGSQEPGLIKLHVFLEVVPVCQSYRSVLLICTNESALKELICTLPCCLAVLWKSLLYLGFHSLTGPTACKLLAVFSIIKEMSWWATFHLCISKFNFPSTQLYAVDHPTLGHTMGVSLQFTTMGYGFLALMLIW